MQPWIDNELATANLGDRRLDRRFKAVLDQVSAHPGVSIPTACNNRADYEAAYRLFANDKVDAAGILAPHAAATRRRAQAHDRVLLIQDTTEIDLTRPNEQLGGPLTSEGRRGLLVHVHLVTTPSGLPLGVDAARIWARSALQATARKSKYRRAEERESIRWLEGYKAATRLARDCHGACEVVAISDSEGDIFACLEQADRDEERSAAAHYVIRACNDRKLLDSEKRLFATVAASDVLFTATLNVRARPAATFEERRRKTTRSQRTAEVAIRACSVEVARPANAHGRRPKFKDGVSVNCVHIRERRPPAGQSAIEWLLVTDLPIGDEDDVLGIIEAYKARWTIEDYFKALKGGCRVEQLQLETQERLETALALYLIVAWRVLYVTRLGRACPDVSCEAVLERDEWQSVYAVVRHERPPAKPPTLKELVRLIGRLGGFADRRRGSAPGTKALWIGLGRMRDFAAAWRAFASEARPCH